MLRGVIGDGDVVAHISTSSQAPVRDWYVAGSGDVVSVFEATVRPGSDGSVATPEVRAASPYETGPVHRGRPRPGNAWLTAMGAARKAMDDQPVVFVHVEPNKHLTAADRTKLARRLSAEYGRGASMAALAARYGTSAGRVRLLLLEQGVELRPRGGDMRSAQARQRRVRAGRRVAPGSGASGESTE